MIDVAKVTKRSVEQSLQSSMRAERIWLRGLQTSVSFSSSASVHAREGSTSAGPTVVKSSSKKSSRLSSDKIAAAWGLAVRADSALLTSAARAAVMSCGCGGARIPQSMNGCTPDGLKEDARAH